QWAPRPCSGVAGFPWNQWQLCYGISGNFRVEQVAALAWNRWQDSPGIGGSFGVEYAPHTVGGQEDHDLADDLLLSPGFDHPLFTFGTNAIKVGQPFGSLLNDVKDLCPKGLDQLFGKVWPDAFDHPGTEILLNAFQGTGWDDS